MLFDPGCSNCGCPAACSPCMPPAVDLWMTGRLGPSGAVFFDHAMPYLGPHVWQTGCYGATAYRLACVDGFLIFSRQPWNGFCTAPSGVATQLYPISPPFQVVTLQCSPFLLTIRSGTSPTADHYTVSE